MQRLAAADRTIGGEFRRMRDLADGSSSVLAERAATIAPERLPAPAAQADAQLAPKPVPSARR